MLLGCVGTVGARGETGLNRQNYGTEHPSARVEYLYDGVSVEPRRNVWPDKKYTYCGPC